MNNTTEEYKEIINDYIRKDFNSMSFGSCEFCYNLKETCGEKEQLETTMTCLQGLIGWCEVCFNNEIEVEDHKLLKQAYDLLEKVHESYEKNYN